MFSVRKALGSLPELNTSWIQDINSVYRIYKIDVPDLGKIGFGKPGVGKTRFWKYDDKASLRLSYAHFAPTSHCTRNSLFCIIAIIAYAIIAMIAVIVVAIIANAMIANAVIGTAIIANAMIGIAIIADISLHVS